MFRCFPFPTILLDFRFFPPPPLSSKVRVEVACRLDSLCVALGEQWSVVTVDILPALVADADPDVRCEVCVRGRRDVRVLHATVVHVDTVCDVL